MFLLTYYELPSIALLSKKKHLSPSDLKRKKFIYIFTLIENKKCVIRPNMFKVLQRDIWKYVVGTKHNSLRQILNQTTVWVVLNVNDIVGPMINIHL